MADQAPSNDASTRWIETSRGIFRYAEIAPLLAEAVLRVQQRIDRGDYASRDLDEEFLCQMHGDFSLELFPDWGGSIRRIQVRVGSHEAPPPHRIRVELRNYFGDLRVRFEEAARESALIPEVLAFAEGRLLSIHPFADFNGRVTRLWLWELLRRLHLPPVELAPNGQPELDHYLAALRAADEGNLSPLTEIWIRRLTMAL